MERKRNYIGKVRDWADDRLRRMCGRITPGKRLAVILVMFFFLRRLVYLHHRFINLQHREAGRQAAANRTHQATAVARQRHNQQYQPLKQTAIWKKYRRMRTARPYRRRTGSLKKEDKPKRELTPAAGAAAQENDSLPADVPCLCRVHVPDIRTLRQRGRERGKRGRLQRRHTPARRGRDYSRQAKGLRAGDAEAAGSRTRYSPCRTSVSPGTMKRKNRKRKST